MANVSLARSPVIPGRFVGAACMRPVAVRPMAAFFGFAYALPGVCRGGIHAARQEACAARGLRENCLFPPLCRAGLRPQARFGLAPQRRFGAQPPKAALSAEMRNRAARPGS